jgi:hypothetical protein
MDSNWPKAGHPEADYSLLAAVRWPVACGEPGSAVVVFFGSIAFVLMMFLLARGLRLSHRSLRSREIATRIFGD